MDTYPQTVTHAIGRWLECGKNVIVGSGQVFVVLGACVSTSRKHGKKELQSFSRCGSFDHHALQSLKQCRFVFLGLPIDTLGILGLIIYRCKGIEYTFATIYHTPPKNKICSRKLEIKILQLFSDCRSGWSKEPQWENDCGFFCAQFSTSHVVKRTAMGKRLQFFFAMFSTSVCQLVTSHETLTKKILVIPLSVANYERGFSEQKCYQEPLASFIEVGRFGCFDNADMEWRATFNL